MHDLSNQVIGQKLATIRRNIYNAAIKAGRDPKDIRLVAVSKFHSADAIFSAIQHNQMIFGENRIQEAKQKFTSLLLENPSIHLHIIGPIQSNKIIDAVKIASVIETIDRPSMLVPLDKAIQKIGRAPKLFIQINTGKEPQKAGIFPEEADYFISLCYKQFGSLIQGVMGIPPVHDDPTSHFKQLVSIAKKYYLPEISIGMSHDYEIAIACGATFVRVGTAIFGNRPLYSIQNNTDKNA